MNKYSLVFTISALLIGCDGKAESQKSLFINGDELEISLSLNKTEFDSTENYSLVYGKIKYIKNNPDTDSVNLNCVEIQIENNASQKIYIDSIAHVLTDPYKLIDPITEIPVYWKIKGKLDRDSQGLAWKPVKSSNC